MGDVVELRARSSKLSALASQARELGIESYAKAPNWRPMPWPKQKRSKDTTAVTDRMADHKTSELIAASRQLIHATKLEREAMQEHIRESQRIIERSRASIAHLNALRWGEDR